MFGLGVLYDIKHEQQLLYIKKDVVSMNKNYILSLLHSMFVTILMALLFERKERP